MTTEHVSKNVNNNESSSPTYDQWHHVQPTHHYLPPSLYRCPHCLQQNTSPTTAETDQSDVKQENSTAEESSHGDDESYVQKHQTLKTYLTKSKCLELLSIYGVQGIEYVIEADPVICRNLVKKTYNVKKDSEDRQSGNVQQKNTTSSNLQVGCFAYGYVGLESNGEIKSSDEERKSSKKLKTNSKEVAKTLIACEIARFDCSVLKLKKDALKMVEKIGDATDTDVQEKYALQFLKKFPAEEFIYKSFAIGGWFCHFSTESSNNERDESNVMTSDSTNGKFSVTAKLSTSHVSSDTTAGYQSTESNSHTSNAISSNVLIERNKNISYAGPFANSEAEILNGLNDPDNWAVFPSPTRDHHNTISICEVVREMAEEMDSQEKEKLKVAADILESIIEKNKLLRTVHQNQIRDDTIRSMDLISFSTDDYKYLGGYGINSFSFSKNVIVGYHSTINANYRIYKYKGNKGDPIRHGDIIMLQQASSRRRGGNILYSKRTDTERLGHHNLTSKKFKSCDMLYRCYWVIEGMKENLVSYKHQISLRALAPNEFDEFREIHNGTLSVRRQISVFNRLASKFRKSNEFEEVDTSMSYICTTSNGEVRLMKESDVEFFQYNKSWNVTNMEKNA